MEYENIFLHFAITIITIAQLLPEVIFMCKEFRPAKSKKQAVISFVLLCIFAHICASLEFNKILLYNMIRCVFIMLLLVFWADKTFIGNRRAKIGFFMLMYGILGTVDGLLGMIISNLSGKILSTQTLLSYERTFWSFALIWVYWLAEYLFYTAWRILKLKIAGKSPMFIYFLFYSQVIILAVTSTQAADTGHLFTFVCIAIILVSQMLLLYGLYMTVKAVQRDMDTIGKDSYKRIEKNYYEKLHESYNEIRKMRHDIRNELAAAAVLIENCETAESGIALFNEIEERYNANDTDMYCNVPVINAILHEKTLSANNKNIMLKTKIPSDFMIQNNIRCKIDEYDLCSIIANIIDIAFCHVNKAIGIDRDVYFELLDTSECISVKCKVPSEIKKNERDTQISISILHDLARKYEGRFDISFFENVSTIDLSLKYVK